MILDTDIKLMASEQLNDSDSGGGQMSAVQVIDGVANNLFGDISRMDRTHGRLSLRKGYLSVQTNATEDFYGAHAIISARATDPAVVVAAFSTQSMTDSRADARGRMESFVALGGRTVYELYGDHLAGSRTLRVHVQSTAFATNILPPSIDDVLVLKSGQRQQFLRVARIVDREFRQFTVADGSGTRSFYRAIYTCELQSALIFDFTANPVSDLVVSNPITAIHDTMPGNGSVYFGCMPLQGALAAGARELMVSNLYAPIVPTADIETPISNWSPWAQGEAIKTAAQAVSAATRRLTWTLLGQGAITPGTAYCDYLVMGKWVRLSDDGAGSLVGRAGQGVGSVDYTTGNILVTLGALPDVGSYVLFGLRTTSLVPPSAELVFRIDGAPLALNSVAVQVPIGDSDLVLMQSQADGRLTGLLPDGEIDYQTGLVRIRFGTAAFDHDRALSITAVGIRKIPLAAELIGIDPVRMPSDGRVPLLLSGQSVVIHHTETTELPSALSNGQQIVLPRTGLAWVELTDANDQRVSTDRYQVDLAAGTVTFGNPINLTGLVAPLKARHRIEEMRLCVDVQFTGEISLALPLTRAFPAGTQCSSILEFGDLKARVSTFFRQAAWGGTWSDTPVGNPPSGSYLDSVYPVQLSNKGAVPQRWALVFTGPESFNIIGEELGLIGTGNVGADCAPINPATGAPYFTLRAQGWSAGWSIGNVLRLNTAGTVAPIWLLRTTQISTGGPLADDFRIELRGDVTA
ncbi:hypothetical protein [Chitinimonas taiwanensis]|uniref:hypothetical protein n=1 Tax=Chitinimonas taiwanensis TaxID=240412 RepID=UPI0035ADDD76